MDGCEVIMWFNYMIEGFGILVMIGIIVFGLFALHYDAKWFKDSTWTSYSVIKIGCAFVSAQWTAMYIYILIRIILGNAIDVNWFGAVWVRPAIFITQFVLAMSARNRYHSLQKQRRNVW